MDMVIRIEKNKKYFYESKNIQRVHMRIYNECKKNLYRENIF